MNSVDTFQFAATRWTATRSNLADWLCDGLALSTFRRRLRTLAHIPLTVMIAPAAVAAGLCETNLEIPFDVHSADDLEIHHKRTCNRDV